MIAQPFCYTLVRLITDGLLMKTLYVFRILKYSQVIFCQEETVVDRNKLHINIIYRMKMELGMYTEKIQSQRY